VPAPGGPRQLAELASHPLPEAVLTSVQDRGRERHYALDRSGLAPVSQLLDELRPVPPFAAAVLDGLDLEVRRTVRERSTTARSDDQQEDTA